MYKCKGVKFKHGYRTKEGVKEMVVIIAHIAELAQDTCYWDAPMDIELITPSMIQYGTYIIRPLPC